MAPRRVTPKAKRWKRRVLGFLLLLVVLVGGAVAAQRAWRRGSARDPMRLDLLQSAWNSFNAQRFDEARETLDRRPADVQPTASNGCSGRASPRPKGGRPTASRI